METAAFSNLLLTLYRAAATTSVNSFRDTALAAVQSHLPFDAAIWATVSFSGEAGTGFVWRVDGAPQEVATLIRACPCDELVMRLLHTPPGQTHVFQPANMSEGPLGTAITALTSMRHVMITVDRNEELGTFNILTLGRRQESQPFGPEEQSLKQMLTPHLEAMVVRNFEAQAMAAMLGDRADSVGLAVLNENAAVLMAEPNFLHLVRREWPAWSGPQLPPFLARAVRAREPALVRGDTRFHLIRRDGHLLAIASRVSAIDSLTRKEYSVAAEFALGKSYKEVARTHGLSPETVRSRLRTVYEKMGVCDKGELSRHFERNKLMENLQALL